MSATLETILKLYLDQMEKSGSRSEFIRYIPPFAAALREAKMNSTLFTQYYLEYRKLDYWKKNNDYKKKEEQKEDDTSDK